MPTLHAGGGNVRSLRELRQIKLRGVRAAGRWRHAVRGGGPARRHGFAESGMHLADSARKR